MKKILLIISLFLLVSCTSKKKDTLTYTNINSEETLAIVESTFSKYFDKEDVDRLLEQINYYNQSVDNDTVIGKFEEMKSTNIEYEIEKIIEKWQEKHPEFIGYNCRLTSYQLYNSLIDVIDTSINDSLLFLDTQSIDNAVEPYNLTNEETEKFKAIFSAISLEKNTDTSKLSDSIKENLDKRLSFKESDAKLISVWFYDDIDINDIRVFVGHVGVLVPYEDEFLFLEKISFEDPYQLIKFKNKTALNDYLMSKYQEYEAVSPLIFENNNLMEEYKVLELK